MEDHNRPVTGYPASNPNGYPPNPPPSGTAYPYTAAPPPNPYYGYPNNPYHQPRRSTFSRRFLAFTIGLIVVLGAVTLIIWLVLRPQVPQFRVDSVTLSNLTISDNSLVSFTSQVRLMARNPNRRLTLAYDRLDAAVYYRSWSLADTVLPPFSLGTKSETQLTANFSSVGNFIERVAADGMNRERGSRGSIVLNLRVLSRVRFRTNAWRTRVRLLQVFCGDLEVGFPSNGRQGTLTGGPRRCRVVV